MKILLSLLILFSGTTYAHVHCAHCSHSEEQNISDFYNHIIDLSLAATTNADAKIVYDLKGEQINGDTYLHQAIRASMRMIADERKNECEDCTVPSDKDLSDYLNSPNNTIFGFDDEPAKIKAQSFLSRQVVDPFVDQIGDIVSEVAPVAGELGQAMAYSTVAFETAETLIGLHLFCKPFQLSQYRFIRDIQSFARAFLWAPQFDTNSATALIKMGLYSNMIKKASTQTRFVSYTELELDPVAAKEVDEEGPRSMFSFAEGKRFKWLKKIIEKKEAKLNGKHFVGKYPLRYLFLRNVKGRTSLHGKSENDEGMDRYGIWEIGVQENIIARALKNSKTPEPAVTPPLPYDEVRYHLAQEAAKGDPEEAEIFDKLLSDISNSFDSQSSISKRKLLAELFATKLQGFYFIKFQKMVEEKSKLFGRRQSVSWLKWKKMGRESWLLFASARLGTYINQWKDYYYNSVRNNADNQYEVMQGFVYIWDYLKKAEALASAQDEAGLRAAEDIMVAGLTDLNTFTPWRPKKSRRSFKKLFFVPVGLKKLTCEELNEEVFQ